MCRKIIPTVIAMLAIILVNIPLARTQNRNLPTDDVKTQISKLRTGPKAAVRVILKDKKKVQGWLSFAGDDHFTVIAEKSGAVADIKYSDVSSVKSLKPSRGALIAAVAGGLGLAVVIFLLAGAKH
jgi:hypothetical protein